MLFSHHRNPQSRWPKSLSQIRRPYRTSSYELEAAYFRQNSLPLTEICKHKKEWKPDKNFTDNYVSKQGSGCPNSGF